MHRLLVFAATGLAGLALSGSALAWSWPADGDVLRPFALGGDAYAAGQHRGVDVAGSEGSAVRAPASGTVTFVGSLPTYGRGVTIATADGYALTLVHLGSISVAKGDEVAEGASIGTMGWSGDAEHAVPSVHLGVRVAGEAEGYVDPLGLLPPRSVTAPATPVQSPAPVAASAAVAPAPAAPPLAPPPTPAPSSPPTAPAAVGQPASEVPATPSVTAPSAAAAAPPVSADSAAADATTAVRTAAAPGLTVTGVGSADSEGDASFRTATRQDASRVPTRATAPYVNERPRVVDAATPTGVTSRPAHTVVPAVHGRRAAAAPGPVARVMPRSPVSAPAVTVHERPSAPVAPPSADGPLEGPIAAPAVAAAVPPDSTAPQPSKPLRTGAVPASSPVDGLRPGALVAAAVLLLIAMAAAATAARRIGGNGAVLRHYPDLLRQLHAAHRARVHDRGGGRVRTPSTAARP